MSVSYMFQPFWQKMEHKCWATRIGDVIFPVDVRSLPCMMSRVTFDFDMGLSDQKLRFPFDLKCVELSLCCRYNQNDSYFTSVVTFAWVLDWLTCIITCSTLDVSVLTSAAAWASVAACLAKGLAHPSWRSCSRFSSSCNQACSVGYSPETWTGGCAYGWQNRHERTSSICTRMEVSSLQTRCFGLVCRDFFYDVSKHIRNISMSLNALFP